MIEKLPRETFSILDEPSKALLAILGKVNELVDWPRDWEKEHEGDLGASLRLDNGGHESFAKKGGSPKENAP